MAAWVPGIYDVGLRLPIKYGLVMTIRIFFLILYTFPLVPRLLYLSIF